VDTSAGLIVYDPKSGKIAMVFPEAMHARLPTFTRDGRFGVTCTTKSGLLVFDCSTLKAVLRLTLKRAGMLALLIDGDGKDTPGACLIVPFSRNSR
jgi:hypothetical protein